MWGEASNRNWPEEVGEMADRKYKQQGSRVWMETKYQNKQNQLPNIFDLTLQGSVR